MRKNRNKIIRIGNRSVEVKEKKWKIGENSWITVARVGVPVTCLLSALVIVVPGIVNSMTAHAH